MTEKFRVEKLDINGDGIPDGDLVIRYVNGKEAGKQFVPFDKLKKIVDNSIVNAPLKKTEQLKVYKTRLPTPQQQKQPVVIENETSMLHYVKAGFGLNLGAQAANVAVAGVADGLSSLFGDEGGAARRRRH